MRPGTPAAALAATLALAVPTAVGAGTTTANFDVQVSVELACEISVGDLDFGTYTSGQSGHLDAQGSVEYSGCSGVELTLGLDDGQHAQPEGRGMTAGGAAVLLYQLFRDEARTEVHGTGADASLIPPDEDGSGSFPIRGRIFKSQTVPPGHYTDTVGVTLGF
jgi:spore coat protein U-like protein